MAAATITKETKLLFLDAIFHPAPRAINLVVESLRATFQIGQNITRISASEGVFGFRNDPSFPVPTLSLILKLSEEPHFFSVPLVLAFGPFLQQKRAAREPQASSVGLSTPPGFGDCIVQKFEKLVGLVQEILSGLGKLDTRG